MPVTGTRFKGSSWLPALAGRGPQVLPPKGGSHARGSHARGSHARGFSGIFVLLVAVVTLDRAPAFAQTPRDAPLAAASLTRTFQLSAQALRIEASPTSRPQVRPASSKASVARKMVGSVIGLFAGVYLGGAAGAAIEGNRCRCDDPGLKGWLIGAPVGGVAGAILGSKVP